MLLLTPGVKSCNVYFFISLTSFTDGTTFIQWNEGALWQYNFETLV